MKIEPCETPNYPGFQFVVTAETAAERILLARIQEVLSENKARPMVHGVTYMSGVGYTSFNFGFLEEKHFKVVVRPEKPKLGRKKK